MKSVLKVSVVLFFILFFTACKDTTSTNSFPNVIIVMTDDQGYGDLGFNGNMLIRTPHIDKFAAQSVNFTNYHAGTTCSPTRAGLMTARNCLRNGVWHTNAGCSLLNQDEETIADVFSAAGYKTAMFGKWHLGDNYSFLPEQRDFKKPSITREVGLVKHQIIGAMTTRMIPISEMALRKKPRVIVPMFFLKKPCHLSQSLKPIHFCVT